MQATNELVVTDESRNKLIALYKFLKETVALRSSAVKNIAKQPWRKYLTEFPELDEFVQISFRDTYSSEETEGVTPPLLYLKKPEFDICPQPDELLLPWLEDGWDDYFANSALKRSLEVRDEESGDVIDTFEVDSFVEEKYAIWIIAREDWAVRQLAIEKIRGAFFDLHQLQTNLKKDSETMELVAANGFIRCADGSGIDHPILAKRVRISFDASENAIAIEDSDSDPEIYSALLRDISDINLDSIRDAELELQKYLYHPFDRNECTAFLRKFVNQLSPKNDFAAEGEKIILSPDSKMVLYMKPVFIFKKKTDGSGKAIERIIEAIESGIEIPAYLRDIVSGGSVESPTEMRDLTVEQRLAEVGGEDRDILLSKEANREQLEIARRIDRYNAVLVQGPPGTGKTHTIANLMGHLLAQGKSILVTSHTTKALSVLKEKLVEGIQNLCVSVLDDSNVDMERSVDGISDFTSRHDSGELKRIVDKVNSERAEIIANLMTVREKIFNALYLEHRTIVIEGQDISPLEAAKIVAANKELMQIIPGDITLGVPLPLTMDELRDLYASNEFITEVEEDELALSLPDSEGLLSPEQFENTVKALKENNALIKNAADTNGLVLTVLGKQNSYSITTKEGRIEVIGTSMESLVSLSKFVTQYKDFESWMVAAAADGKRGGGYLSRWEQLFDQIRATSEISARVVQRKFGKVVEVENRDLLLQSRDTAVELQSIYSRKGKIGKFDLAFNKNAKAVYGSVVIDGLPLDSSDDFSLLIDLIDLEIERKKSATYWHELMGKRGAPEFADLNDEDPERIAHHWIERIEDMLNWYGTRRKTLVDLLEDAGFTANDILKESALDSEEKDVERTLLAVEKVIPAMIEILLARLEVELNEQAIEGGIRPFRRSELKESAAASRLVRAVDDLDVLSYKSAFNMYAVLYAKYALQAKRKMLLEKLSTVAPGWSAAIESREGIHGEATVPEGINKAWLIRQYELNLKEMFDIPLKELQNDAVRLSGQYRTKTAELAEAKAWLALLKQTENDISLRQALQGWKQTVKKIGKGTGKQAALYKAQARKMMADCQKAVPAWVMPMGKALESLDPTKNIFDVVIVDEASQSDVSALAIAFMAKKIIIVGDEKQVSPLGVGTDETRIANLANIYIKDRIPNYHLYSLNTSLYDIAATTFHPLMLREHFRCVPLIIGYSNKLSYDGRIKPLRDSNSVVTLPSVVNYRVADGYRDYPRSINEGEAREIIALIRACLEQAEYDGKTFGIISLLGDEQVKLIQRLLYENLEPQVIEERQILCGNAANFQGDERDVIFLSMVDSKKPNSEGPLVLLGFGGGDLRRKRYNVATSRAKDQLWVVYSLDVFNDLKAGDIRRDLIEYATDPQAFVNQAEDIKRNADSPFEAEVCSALMARGYKVVQQWQVGAYRIDMVAVGSSGKVAIECDGERWHSGEDKIFEDMERQSILERLGWRFVRIRGSEYYRDKELTIARVVDELKRLKIDPLGSLESGESSGVQSELLDRVRARAYELLHESDANLSEKQVLVDATLLAEDASRGFTGSLLKANSTKDASRDPAVVCESVSVEQLILADCSNDVDASEPKSDIANRMIEKGDSSLACEVPGDTDSLEFELTKLDFEETEIKEACLFVGETSNGGSSKSSDPLLAALIDANLRFEDKRRKGGALWVWGGKEREDALGSFKKYASFTFKKGGGNVTMGEDAWYTNSSSYSNALTSMTTSWRPRQSKEAEKQGEKKAALQLQAEKKPKTPGSILQYVEAYISAVIPNTAIDPSDYDSTRYSGAIEDRMRKVIDAEAPIEQQRLFNEVRESFGISRSGSNIQFKNESILKIINHSITTFNGSTYIWKDGSEPDTYGAYRPNEGDVYRNINEFPYEELVCAMLDALQRPRCLSKSELIKASSKNLGFKSLKSRVKDTLEAALDEALKFGEIEKASSSMYKAADR